MFTLCRVGRVVSTLPNYCSQAEQSTLSGQVICKACFIVVWQSALTQNSLKKTKRLFSLNTVCLYSMNITWGKTMYRIWTDSIVTETLTQSAHCTTLILVSTLKAVYWLFLSKILYFNTNYLSWWKTTFSGNKWEITSDIFRIFIVLSELHLRKFLIDYREVSVVLFLGFWPFFTT